MYKAFSPQGVSRVLARILLASACATSVTGSAAADARGLSNKQLFQHVGTFDVRKNGSLSAEIVAASANGRTLIYTDSQSAAIGFVDVSDPVHPRADGTLAMGGEPTSVTVHGPYALVAVNTSASFASPSGKLEIVDLATRTVVHSMSLPGQPDSVDLSPDGKYAAVVIENERDEDLNDGLIPQAPAGSLVVLRVQGQPSGWTARTVDLRGLAPYATDDPEPEYVDINANNLAVVSLQENNHLAIVDLRTARVVQHFGAGSVRVENVDATEEKIGPQNKGDIQLSQTIERRREPDTVQWVDHDTFATANEGDYEDEDGEEGGSRSFTLFNTDGSVEFEAYASFEHAAVRVGHYNESRSANKGGEPEALASARFGRRQLLFVGAERANVLGVYDVSSGAPQLLQMLPTGVGPEGIATVPARELVAVAAETPVGAVPSLITLYQLGQKKPEHPQLSSADDARGLPIPWVAMSGLAADPYDAQTLYAVSDSILGKGYIYPIDVAGRAPTLIDRIEVKGASFNLDLEGIAVRGEGGFWLASEGRIAGGKVERPDALVRVDDAGLVLEEVLLPEGLRAQANSSGFEGLAVLSERGREVVYAVLQREWADDAAGSVKLARYDVAARTWTFARYALDAVPAVSGAWVGLSELTLLPNGKFAIIERDNQLGENAQVKRVYGVDLTRAEFRPYGDARGLVTVAKSALADLLPELAANSILTPDKLEGLAVAKNGRAYAVTDNDGLDAALGQTVWLELGRLGR